jgi:hypothetical protein
MFSRGPNFRREGGFPRKFDPGGKFGGGGGGGGGGGNLWVANFLGHRPQADFLVTFVGIRVIGNI